MKKAVKHFKKYFGIYLFLFSLAVRLVYTFILRDTAFEWVGDEGVYYLVADGLLKSQGYFSFSRPPLWPGIIILLIKIFGNTVWQLHIASCFIGALLPVTVYLFAKRFFNKYSLPYLAGLYAALYPYFIHTSSMLDSENLFIPLTIWLTITFIDLLEKEGFKKYIIFALVLALTSLGRPAIILLPFFFFVFLIFKKANRATLLGFLGALVLFFILLLPWNIFVSCQVGKPTYITPPYATFSGSNNPVTFTDPTLSGDWINLDDDFPEIAQEVAALGLSEVGISIHYFKEYWYRVPWLLKNKFKWLWSYSPKNPKNRNFTDDLLGFFSYGLILPFFVIGLFRYGRQTSVQLIILLAAHYTFLTLLTCGNTRFRLPLDVYIIPLALLVILDVISAHYSAITKRLPSR